MINVSNSEELLLTIIYNICLLLVNDFVNSQKPKFRLTNKRKPQFNQKFQIS